MRQISVAADEVTIALSTAELRVLANALNETLEAVDPEEFDTRVGVAPSAAEDLLDQVQAVLAGS